jgi:hypothetical protein
MTEIIKFPTVEQKDLSAVLKSFSESMERFGYPAHLIEDGCEIIKQVYREFPLLQHGSIQYTGPAYMEMADLEAMASDIRGQLENGIFKAAAEIKKALVEAKLSILFIKNGNDL